MYKNKKFWYNIFRNREERKVMMKEKKLKVMKPRVRVAFDISTKVHKDKKKYDRKKYKNVEY